MGKNKLTDEQVEQKIKDKVKGSKVIIEAVEVSKRMSEDMPGFGKSLLIGFKDLVFKVFEVIFWKVPVAIFITPFYNAFRSK